MFSPGRNQLFGAVKAVVFVTQSGSSGGKHCEGEGKSRNYLCEIFADCALPFAPDFS